MSGSSQHTIKYNSNNFDTKKNVRCFKCKRFGNYKNKCRFNTVNNEPNKNAFSIAFLTGTYNKTDWYFDSGPSIHLVNDSNSLREYNKKPDVQEVRTANNMQIKVVSCGSVSLKTKFYGQVFYVDVQDAHYVPQLAANLLSVSSLTRKYNNVIFIGNECKIYNKTNTLVAVALLTGEVFELIINNINCLLVADPKSGNVRHKRLSHINKTDLCN
ncbi:uncharacterized protein LOC113371465 [Ctenocephalides felis]|uniref:uncharacterized protein LOC113371465 n=1 Tax=Ctenocephalides felis TaxID=7515 RepID=UPI000E6E4AED|nr:uncharacterized protein LOC113371465 [Ctenocephalides felis]